MTSDYSYNQMNQLSGFSHNPAGTEYDQTVTFEYNRAGQIVKRSAANERYTRPMLQGHLIQNYQMDAQNRIAQMVTLRAYSAPSVPFLNFTTSFQYDANGNMTHDGTTSFAYDNDNQLVSANGASLSYDAVGRLYEVSKSGVTTRFLYDGNRLIGELNTNNGYLRRYVHGTGVDEPLVWLEGDSVWDRRWLLTDERGSVIAATNQAGTVTAINTYDEYGKPGSGNQGRFQYTGQVWLAEVGLYHYKARVYSPTLGRFLQPDPIGYADGMNLYAYVGGDPINARDPTGLAYTFNCWTKTNGTTEYYDVEAEDMPHSNCSLVTVTHGNGGGGDPFGYHDPLGDDIQEFMENLFNELPQKDGCAYRNSSGQCVYVRNDKGTLDLDPEYSARACEAYKAMMQSNKEVSRYTGAAGQANGARGILQKGANWDFLKTPLAFDVVMYSLGITTYLLGQSEPPPGCAK
ncbi:RHS repeat domain-containing protein [Niveispirillum irakense]|uniref:RHS repeat domain-containing protein n=1 Tax=Niveispirillum irakense TaxID=34011 RepID=UPI000685893F|nr:RHS repeat-associated core domain-containing protein [Niveispirillum irakense]